MDKCVDCVYWTNVDDPKESCKDSYMAEPDDETCEEFEKMEAK